MSDSERMVINPSSTKPAAKPNPPKDVPYTQDNPEEQKYSDDPDYIRIDNFPSKFISYTFSGIFARQKVLKDWAKTTVAVNHQNITAFIDALDPTISVPIRDLVYQDFVWLMYWHRINSYPNKPIKITWMSKYGNLNDLSITTRPKTNNIGITKEEYKKKFGTTYRMPTVRDYEVLMSNLLDEEQTLLYEEAQFYQNNLEYPSDKEKIQEYVNDLIGLAANKKISEVEGLDKIRETNAYGIIEEVTVKDQHYKYKDYVKRIEGMVSEAITNNSDSEEIAFLNGTLSEIKGRKEKGEDLSEPDEETVTHEFSPWGFFPNMER